MYVFEDVIADGHPLGIAGEVAPWAFGQFWRKYGVDLNGGNSAVSS